MVAPLGNVGMAPIAKPNGESLARPMTGTADFGATLEKALQANGGATTRPAAGGPLLDAGFGEAFRSIERASAHIQNARAYFKSTPAASDNAPTPRVARPFSYKA